MMIILIIRGVHQAESVWGIILMIHIEEKNLSILMIIWMITFMIINDD